MGQQQIFLILLVTILIGIATLIAITLIKDLSTKHIFHQDMHVGLNIAQEIMEKHRIPTALGGGGGSFDAKWVNFNTLNCPYYSDGDTICKTVDRTSNAVYITLYPMGKYLRMRFAEHERLTDPTNNNSHVPGSVRLAIEWRIDDTGIHPVGPVELTQF